MKTTFIYSIILLLAGGFFIYTNIKLTKERDDYKDKYALFENYKILNEDAVAQRVKNNNIKLGDDLVLTGLDNQKYKLKDLVKKTGIKMIIRHNERGCGTCIEQELLILSEYSKAIGPENILLISSHDSVRKLQVFKTTHNFDFTIVSCPKLLIPFEKDQNRPYIFTIDSNLVIGNFHIPEVDEPSLSKVYYSAIAKNYFGKKLSNTDQVAIIKTSL